MNALILALVAVMAAAVLAYTAVYLARVIRDDGAGQARRTPPRSHPDDMFDPRSRLA
jgi:hypothetical protein